ncbi:MAG: carboxypeptidase-like regulatory domain-containing protein, partial [bacterium]
MKGRVVADDGSPVSSAHIRSSHNDGDSTGTKTDAEGYFTIVLPRNEPKNLYINAGNKYGALVPLLTDFEDSVTLTIQLDSVNQPRFQFENPGSRIARFARLHLDLFQNYISFVQSLQKLQKDRQDTKSFFTAWNDSVTNLKQMVLAEKDSVIRGELLLRYYRLTTIPGLKFDSVFYQKFITSISVNSPLWFFNNYEAYDQSHQRPDGKAFVDSIIANHPSRELRAFLLFETAREAQFGDNEQRVRQNYAKLKQDFPDISWSKLADKVIFADRKLKQRTEIPDFIFKD